VIVSIDVMFDEVYMIHIKHEEALREVSCLV